MDAIFRCMSSQISIQIQERFTILSNPYLLPKKLCQKIVSSSQALFIRSFKITFHILYLLPSIKYRVPKICLSEPQYLCVACIITIETHK